MTQTKISITLKEKDIIHCATNEYGKLILTKYNALFYVYPMLTPEGTKFYACTLIELDLAPNLTSLLQDADYVIHLN